MRRCTLLLIPDAEEGRLYGARAGASPPYHRGEHPGGGQSNRYQVDTNS